MFDYVNRMQLALGDKARRTGLKAAAGVAFLVGGGFLIAAGWSWLAWERELGPIMASLIIGGVFVLLGLIVWATSSGERHRVPTTEELRDEVETRLSGAADAAIGKVKHQAESVVDGAKARVSSLFGGVAAPIRSVADTARNVADSAFHAVGGTGNLASEAGEKLSDVAAKGGEVLKDARETLDRAVETKAGPAIGLAGAFAVGLVIASALRGSRSKEDLYYDDDWDDEDYY